MLELRNIRAGYGRFQVLHGLNLVVPAGSTVALLGANGAGKTTLLNVAAGLLRPSAGDVILDGVAVTSRPAYQRTRRGVCLVPEGRGIFRQLTVRENLAMYAGGRDVKAAIDEAVAAFPILKDRLTQVAGTMSGGQQQMLAVSRALVSDAPVILADELSVGLAPVVVDEIFEAVRQLREAGRSLLIVEQYVSRALAVADYVYILHKGRVAFVGEPEQCEDGNVFERYIGSVA
ncbi:MAG TPA: ABC transporter ATP-binding protein [Acidimicrobiia bacterium]|jgi:branched-chain amino acid transport system ATP-binding protein|nr:ABC transporter ATP-binding protein [Acidimicrobiia bacterium]